MPFQNKANTITATSLPQGECFGLSTTEPVSAGLRTEASLFRVSRQLLGIHAVATEANRLRRRRMQ